MKTRFADLLLIFVISVFLVGCAAVVELGDGIVSTVPPVLTRPPIAPTSGETVVSFDSSCPQTLTSDECRSLASLQKVDDYPLYTMHYWSSSLSESIIERDKNVESYLRPTAVEAPWGCSLFAVFADPKLMLFGRNFDWRYSPALLLYSHQAGAYNSVSMVDIEYLGFSGEEELTDLSLIAREKLLQAPMLPFDGMNEKGLVIGMAAVPPGQREPDPQKPSVDSLKIMRIILDQAADVDEAISLIGDYNIDMGSGPPLHYLIADSSRTAAVVEFYDSEMIVLPSEGFWQGATNFLQSPVKDDPKGYCWRYDILSARMNTTAGIIEAETALILLNEVSQPNTQWSIVYNLNNQDISVAMGRDYDSIHRFEFGSQ